MFTFFLTKVRKKKSVYVFHISVVIRWCFHNFFLFCLFINMKIIQIRIIIITYDTMRRFHICLRVHRTQQLLDCENTEHSRSRQFCNMNRSTNKTNNDLFKNIRWEIRFFYCSLIRHINNTYNKYQYICKTKANYIPFGLEIENQCRLCENPRHRFQHFFSKLTLKITLIRRFLTIKCACIWIVCGPHKLGCPGANL